MHAANEMVVLMWGKAITSPVLQVVIPSGEDFGIAGLQASLAALLIGD